MIWVRAALGAVLGQAESSPPPAFVEGRFPFLAQPWLWGVEGWQWIAIACALALAVGVGAGVSHASYMLSKALTKRKPTHWFVAFHKAVRAPLAALLALGALVFALHHIGLTGHARHVADLVFYQVLVAGGAWFAIVGGASIGDSLELRLIGAGEYASRGLRTELKVAQRIYVIAVVLVAGILILRGIHVIEHVGTSLLASAGLASLVIGLAAQKSLGGILAGVQLSISQPVRVGDTVVVDTNYGTVEQIHLTFIVLRLWDQRRLIVPVNRFLESSFENWTRVGTEVMGAVEFPVSDDVSLDGLRSELARICKSSPLYNGKTCSIQVVDLGDKTLKLQAKVSADNPKALFDLRCEVREKLAAYLRSLREQPAAPPNGQAAPDGRQMLPRR